MLMKMSDEEATGMYEELAENSQQFNTRGRQAKRGAYAINANDGIQAEMAAMKYCSTNQALSPQSSQKASTSDVCAICSKNDHATNLFNFVGQGGYSAKNNPYSNTYNPGWRDHPNFSYANQRNVLNPSQGNTQLQGTAPGFSELKRSSLEDSIAALAQSQLAFQQSTQTFQQQTQPAIQTTQASLQKLEIQLRNLTEYDFLSS
ncbi:hypothetical protein D8674_008837 [Pyrus ussuriensis x Pyrus communis]|uniref:Uncharacterized protein n=1 Tax=Pyrus ussuriensis x Pyrus communis TaxID=2448454 RepID=A0A5N5HUV2_9ROSA|nr:hypothetical protein D8674_008837 [Pyrus ussuriensis x Pyrus communis]